ncbi:T9SS type A sorting domain-containing protein [Labilibacter marinus]|uniref:T9SS type A sorting domain-containing protein n=1 Tax=Labilibacter marinus TaxID=1477105 RepID=UPI00083696A1|nr:T9SS type A sorting domain-containing protein [Labilibacter marinus]
MKNLSKFLKQLGVMLLMITLALGSFAQTKLPANYSIKIDVLLQNSLEDYTVSFNEEEFYIEAGQNFEVNNLPTGRYQFIVTAQGYESQKLTIRLKDKDIVKNVQLHKEEFTVTFFDDDGFSVLKEDRVNFGHSPVAPKVPSKHGYTFIGWSKEVKPVESDVSYLARYKRNSEKSMLELSSIQVYPNPTRNYINVDLNMTSLETLVDITIVDISGSVVYLDKTCNVKNVIDVSGFSSGIYYVKVADRSFKILKL